jgi:hypothetical protein
VDREWPHKRQGEDLQTAPESPLTQINPKCIVLQLWAWRTIRYEPTSSGSMCRSHYRTVLGSSPSGPTISFLLFSVSCPSFTVSETLVSGSCSNTVLTIGYSAGFSLKRDFARDGPYRAPAGRVFPFLFISSDPSSGSASVPPSIARVSTNNSSPFESPPLRRSPRIRFLS